MVVAVEDFLKCIECKLHHVVKVLQDVSNAEGKLDLEQTAVKDWEVRISLRNADFNEGHLDGGTEGGPLGLAGIEVNNPLLAAQAIVASNGWLCDRLTQDFNQANSAKRVRRPSENITIASA
jgi:hypothetical protein